MSLRPGPIPGILPLETRRLVVAACERFEGAWREGARPAIGPYLEGLAPVERRAVLHELVALEIELRSAEGDRPTLEELVGRFPDDASVVAAALATSRDALRAWTTTESSSCGPSAQETGPLAQDQDSDPGPGTTESTPPSPPNPESTTPERLGDFRVIGWLGRGGFGQVFRAWDEQLDRAVALKVALPGALGGRAREDMLLAEARAAARLRHPGIVTVFRVGRLDSGQPFLAMEYIEGQSLASIFRDEPRPWFDRLARWVERVAEAAHHAHENGVFHRDLTPANILIDVRDEPHVADFGLAIREDSQKAKAGEVAGTARFMAPEQVRGEPHRLDGRTDIWALGVILYRGLTGRMPFNGSSREEVFDEILRREPKPPRQIDAGIPAELERICLRCLSKRMTDRYNAAIALAEDLHAWLSRPPVAGSPVAAQPAAPLQVAPKGLRPFDEGDADLFLGLLPGPRGRDGVPESVHFWRARLGARRGGTGVEPFGVGVLYGPSGGGKSSFVQAGLMPRLGPEVSVVRLDSTPEGTEAHLLAALRRVAPGLPDGIDLAAAVAALRAGEAGRAGGKVLIVLDQFEQWLQAHSAGPDAPLAQALRQCDGLRVQALLLTRDEFWMAVTRFFRAIEVPLAEGVNSAPVELPEARHARAVLEAFGRACGRFTGPCGEPSDDEARFLDAAVAGLAGPDGLVIPVRLSFFAEVVRRRPWVPATFAALGGIDGIGVTFLEEAFDSPTAPPSYRLHRRAAQGVLRVLLPAPASRLRGGLRSGRELREAIGYADRPADFRELIRILDAELRLVTPVDPVAADAERPGPGSAPHEPYYQLAHDFLVDPIRTWLERDQRSTRAGRATLRLASIAAAWCDRPGPRRLPSLSEWMSILAATRRRSWSGPERRMMNAAARHYVARSALVASAVALAAAGYHVTRERAEASARLEQALTADLAQLPALFGRLDPYRDRIIEDLSEAETDSAASARRRFVAGALLNRYRPTGDRAAALRARLPSADPDELTVIRLSLAASPETAGRGALWDRTRDERADPAARLRAAAVLGLLDPEAAAWSGVAPAVAAALGNEDRGSVRRWARLLEPAWRAVVPALTILVRTPEAEPNVRTAAAEALAELIGTQAPDPEALAELLPDAPPDAFTILARALEQLGAGDREKSAAVLDRLVAADTDALQDTEPDRDRAARREAQAAIGLARLGHGDRLWPRLVHRPDPRVRSLLIDRLPRLGGGTKPLVDRLPHAADPGERQALLLTLAGSTSQPGLDREAITGAARSILADDPDPGVHSAAELLLHRLGRDDLRRGGPAAAGPAAGRRWFLGPNGHTFAVTGPLEGWVGTPGHEADRKEEETRHYVRTGRSLAVAMTEVTVAQYREFLRENPGVRTSPYISRGRDPETAIGYVDWYDAVRYCNWLSAKAGLPRVYREPVGPGMSLDAGDVALPGYRLPTEAEWELFCRAGSTTARPFEATAGLLPKYAWTWLNSDDKTQLVAQLWPNRLGLFDIIGNQWEWCHDGLDERRRGVAKYPPGTPEAPAADLPGPVTVVGTGATDDPTPASVRSQRGGAFDYAPKWSRSGSRYHSRSFIADAYSGLRVVRTMQDR